MTLPSLEFYTTLITSEHADKPKFKAWVEVLLKPLIDSMELNESIKYAFDLNTAKGVQLDILGKILGVDRRVNFEPTDGSSSLLSDDNYRIILKAKIIKNQWKGTISNFYSFWKVLFKDTLSIFIIDNQDMDPVAVVWDNQITQIVQDLLENHYIIPKPAGLGLTVRRVDPSTLFGFSGSGLNGFGQGVFWNY